jgi:hypothetical protein
VTNISLKQAAHQHTKLERELRLESRSPASTATRFWRPQSWGPHKAALRGVFGETLSDEFVDVMLTQLVGALRPGPFDVLEEATLNAGIALIASVKPQSELEALIAVQIAATGFTGLKFLQQSQRHLDEAFIGVYGGYGTRLLHLQLELIQALDRHRAWSQADRRSPTRAYPSRCPGGSRDHKFGEERPRRGRARKMTHDPMHPALEPEQLRQAPRCGASTRSGRPCRSPAVTGRRRCRMHGGAPGSGGPKGSRNGNYKRGLYTAEAIASRR